MQQDIQKNNTPLRVASIDVFRALTMLLMIWVNDFWTLKGVPKWLEHAAAGEDFLGFSDVIFPWFLFIVGLSIPFAIENRLRKGDSKLQILLHILLRSIAMLIIGFFHVNYNNIDPDATGISRALFIIISTLAFFLIWNNYPKSDKKWKYLFLALQVLGVMTLIILAAIFKGKDPETWMRPQWWGIMGLIGWTYLIATPLYLLFRQKGLLMWLFLIAFVALNIFADKGLNYRIFSWQSTQWFIGNGAFHAFAFGGIVTSQLLTKFSKNKTYVNLHLSLLGLSLFSLVSGFILHKYIIISKIGATSTWVMFCLASAFVLFAFLHWLVDLNGKKAWFKLIKTAGTATLTCYLIPYFYYNFRTIFQIKIDGFLSTGIVGLTKSMVFAFIIIGITWILGRIKIQLKL